MWRLACGRASPCCASCPRRTFLATKMLISCAIRKKARSGRPNLCHQVRRGSAACQARAHCSNGRLLLRWPTTKLATADRFRTQRSTSSVAQARYARLPAHAHANAHTNAVLAVTGEKRYGPGGQAREAHEEDREASKNL